MASTTGSLSGGVKLWKSAPLICVTDNERILGLGYHRPGGFAEYFKAPARNLLALPGEVPFDIGGLTSCAVITDTMPIVM